MKKLITLLFVLIMLAGLAGCAKKEERIHVGVTIVDDEETGMETDTVQRTLDKLLEELSASKLFTVETKTENGNVYIDSVNGKKDEGSVWKVYVNDVETTDAINNIQLNEGDHIKIVYDAGEPAPADGGALLGGWTTSETFNDFLITEDEMKIFTQATGEMLGVVYQPVRVLATQVVSGTNYAFLAHGLSVTAVPESAYYIVTIYADLNGNAEVKAINKLDVPNLETTDTTDEYLLGAWTVQGTGKAMMFADEKAQASFDKAIADLVGVGYNPIQLLATQVVSGTNYMGLAEGRVVGSDTYDIYVITWYEDLQGNSSITDIKKLNLLYYVTGE